MIFALSSTSANRRTAKTQAVVLSQLTPARDRNFKPSRDKETLHAAVRTTSAAAGSAFAATRMTSTYPY